MDIEITVGITLLKPPAGVDYGLQKGGGNMYETIQKQRSTSVDLSFFCAIRCKGDPLKDELPKLSGPFVHGPAGQKFMYINIGASAGQRESIWNRRLKIPLTHISWNMVEKLAANPHLILTTAVPGTGKDAGPNCATVKPFAGWEIAKR